MIPDKEPVRLTGNLAWDIFGWWGALVAALFGPRWLVVLVVVVLIAKDVAASRVIYWQREIISLKEDR